MFENYVGISHHLNFNDLPLPIPFYLLIIFHGLQYQILWVSYISIFLAFSFLYFIA